MAGNQIGRHDVIVIQQEHDVSPNRMQPGVASRTLSGLLANDDPQRQVGEPRGPAGLTTVRGGLIDDDDLQGGDALLSQLGQQIQ